MKTKIPKKKYDLYKELRKYYSDKFVCDITEGPRGYGMTDHQFKDVKP